MLHDDMYFVGFMQLFQIPSGLVATTHVLFLRHTRLEEMEHSCSMCVLLQVYTFLKLGVIFIMEQ